MPKHAIHPFKNVLLLHWEKTPKIFHIGCHKINAPNSCCYLSIIFISIEMHGLCKSYSKRDSIGKKWTSVRINKTMGTPMLA
jgi:hypothetical protein